MSWYGHGPYQQTTQPTNGRVCGFDGRCTRDGCLYIHTTKNQRGVKANVHYYSFKCDEWEKTGTCQFGKMCRFDHIGHGKEVANTSSAGSEDAAAGCPKQSSVPPADGTEFPSLPTTHPLADPPLLQQFKPTRRKGKNKCSGLLGTPKKAQPAGGTGTASQAGSAVTPKKDQPAGGTGSAVTSKDQPAGCTLAEGTVCFICAHSDDKLIILEHESIRHDTYCHVSCLETWFATKQSRECPICREIM
jgi:hypothetical protein